MLYYIMGVFTVRKSSVRLAVLAVFYIIFLVIGASIFSAVEGPEERAKVKMLRQYRQKFLKDNSRCLTDAELEAFIVEIVKANNLGVSAVRNVTNEPNWSFGQAIFFTGTVLTTIGYGHVTPLSEGGKVFCIVYAIIGIPLTLIMFSALVERLMIPTTLILEFMQKKLGHLYQTIHIKIMHFAGLILFLVVVVFLIPAVVFYTLEPNWNYLDAFYYCFISMTTIGLGDYIPGDNPDQKNYRAVYKILTTFYLFLGLILMMVMLAQLHHIPELNLGFHFYMASDEGSEEERTQLRPLKKAGSYTEQRNESETQETYQGNNINSIVDDQTKLTEK